MAITDYIDLCAEAPDETEGMPFQVEGSDDVEPWRFVVQIALPAGADAGWGSALQPGGKWGIAKWGERARDWVDVTCRFRGASWDRGADAPGERFRVGTGTIELDNADFALSRYTPNVPDGANATASAWFTAGTLIRWGVLRPANPGIARAAAWYPMFTGFTETWDTSTTAYDANPRAIVTVSETLSLLAMIDGNALSPAGAGDDPETRFDRLLDAAEWPFDRDLSPVYLPTFQATEMSLNRLAEIYLTADCALSTAFSGRDGSIVVRSKPAVGGLSVPPPWFVFGEEQHTYAEATNDMVYLYEHLFGAPGSAETVEVPFSVEVPPRIGSDVAQIVNERVYARVGSTARSKSNTASIGRYGRRRFSRFDLIVQTDAQVDEILLYDLPPYSTPSDNAEVMIQLDAGMSSDMVRDIARCIVLTDLGSYRPFWLRSPCGEGPNRAILDAVVISERHDVSVAGPQRLAWNCTYSLEGLSGDWDTWETLDG